MKRHWPSTIEPSILPRIARSIRSLTSSLSSKRHMPRYNPATIEPKWQSYWETNKTFRCPDLPAGEKIYILDMFPYPSGAGLHVGHPEGYTATDIQSRYWRMRGKSVLHPMGYDAFGLPAEEYAIKHNVPPRISTETNIGEFTRQLKMLGFSYDWDRCLATSNAADPLPNCQSQPKCSPRAKTPSPSIATEIG